MVVGWAESTETLYVAQREAFRKEEEILGPPIYLMGFLLFERIHRVVCHSYATLTCSAYAMECMLAMHLDSVGKSNRETVHGKVGGGGGRKPLKRLTPVKKKRFSLLRRRADLVSSCLPACVCSSLTLHQGQFKESRVFLK